MDSSGCSTPEADQAAALQMWPWSWSGWREHFSAAGYLISEERRVKLSGNDGLWMFLTADEINKAYASWTASTNTNAPQKTLLDSIDPELITADGWWVDFFPDEIDRKAWDQLRGLAHKMHFLPPLVQLSHRSSKNICNYVLITDQPGGIKVPTPEPIATGSKPLTYHPRNIPPAFFEKSFGHLHLRQLQDLAEVVNCHGWILQFKNAQNEQAVYTMAQKHGIKVAFWDKAYSSPLRYLSGYETAFEEDHDKSLRSRLKRAYSDFTSTHYSPPAPDIHEVKKKFGFTQLGLSFECFDFTFDPNILGFTSLRPTKMLSRFQNSAVLPALPAAIQALSGSLATKGEQLRARTWRAFIACILSSNPIQARRSWYYAWLKYPQATLKHTVEVLYELLEAKISTHFATKVLLQTILHYKIDLQGVKELLDFLKNTEKRWLTPGSSIWGWDIKALVGVLEGQNPQEILPAEYLDNKTIKGLWASYAVINWRKGNSETAHQAMQYEIQRQTTEDFTTTLTLRTLFETNDSGFESFLKNSWPAGYKGHAALACLEFTSYAVADGNWINQHRTALEKLTEYVAHAPSNDVWAGITSLYLRAWLGDLEPINDYQKKPAEYGPEAIVWLGLIYFFTHQLDAVGRCLDLSKSSLGPDTTLALSATLNHLAGRRDISWTQFDTLKSLNPAFWRSSFISERQDMIAVMMGMMGKASGNEMLTAHALARLHAPHWEDRRSAVHNTQRVSAAGDIDPKLIDWMMQA